MATLYELTGDYLKLMDMAEDPDTDAQTLTDTMEAIGGEIEDKADGYAKVISALRSDVSEIDAEIKRLEARKVMLQNNADSMRLKLQSAMEATGKLKFKTALFSFGIHKNPPKAVIDSDVPEKWLIPQPPKVDTTGIRKALMDGQKLNFAHLEQGQSLRIK